MSGKKSFATAAILAGIALSFGLALSPGEEANKYTVPEDFQERENWSRQLAFTRTAQVQMLIGQMKQLKSLESERMVGSRLWSCVHELGIFRLEEAVPDLLDLIDLELPQATAATEANKESEVITALSRIGGKATQMTIDRLAKDPSAERVPRYLRVLYLLQGPHVGKLLLQHAVENEADTAGQARLKKALELFSDADKIVS